MMEQRTITPPRRSVWQAMWAELCYHKADFGQMALICVGIYFFFALIFGGGTLLFNDGVIEPELLTVMGVMPLASGMMVVTIVFGGQISVYHNIGVQMSMPRRFMIVRSLWVGLMQQICWIGVALLLYAATGLFGKAMGYEMVNIFKEGLPDIAWAALFFLPLALGNFGAAVLVRFGRKGFWVMYFIFLAVMVGPSMFPSVLEDSGHFAFFWDFIAGLNFNVQGGGFWGCMLLMAALFAAGAVLLWRAPVRS